VIPHGVPISQPLEWGTSSVEPGSRVFDQLGQMIFTDTEVAHASTMRPGQVVELLAVDAVLVLWRDAIASERVACDHLVVHVPAPRRAS
jgi:hypothetical protein